MNIWKAIYKVSLSITIAIGFIILVTIAIIIMGIYEAFSGKQIKIQRIEK